MSYYNPRLDPLEKQLRDARKAIIALMPEELQPVLDLEFNRLTSRDQYGPWRQQALEKVLEAAKPREPEVFEQYVSLSQRARCPLCGASPRSTPGHDGYAYPTGLRSHLEGTHRVKECSVFYAACELNFSYIEEHEQREKELARIARSAQTRPRAKRVKAGAAAQGEHQDPARAGRREYRSVRTG